MFVMSTDTHMKKATKRSSIENHFKVLMSDCLNNCCNMHVGVRAQYSFATGQTELREKVRFTSVGELPLGDIHVL